MDKKTLSDKLISCMSNAKTDKMKLSCKKRFKLSKDNPKAAKSEDSHTHWTGVPKQSSQLMNIPNAKKGSKKVNVMVFYNEDGSIEGTRFVKGKKK